MARPEDPLSHAEHALERVDDDYLDKRIALVERELERLKKWKRAREVLGADGGRRGRRARLSPRKAAEASAMATRIRRHVGKRSGPTIADAILVAVGNAPAGRRPSEIAKSVKDSRGVGEQSVYPTLYRMVKDKRLKAIKRGGESFYARGEVATDGTKKGPPAARGRMGAGR